MRPRRCGRRDHPLDFGALEGDAPEVVHLCSVLPGEKGGGRAVAVAEPGLETGVARGGTLVDRAGGALLGDRVEVGDDEGAQLQEVEKSEEDVRIGAADFHGRDVLAGELGLAGLGLLQLVDDHRQQQALARAFDEYGLVGEEEVAARQGEVLVEKPLVLHRRTAQPLAQILDPGVAHSVDGGGNEIADRLEPCCVGDVGGVGRHDELDRPGQGSVLGLAELAGDVRDLADEHFLHLWMQMGLGLFDEDEVDPGRGRFRAEVR